jgi:hypothetical protein
MKTKNQIVEILKKYNLLIDENTGQCAISDSDFDRIADEILQPETNELTAERIISNPKECGYRSRNPYLIDDTFSCLNPKDKNTVCNDTEKFPDNCPLQAYRTEGLREELIKLLKDEQVENTYGVEEIEDIVDKYLSSGK